MLVDGSWNWTTEGPHVPHPWCNEFEMWAARGNDYSSGRTRMLDKLLKCSHWQYILEEFSKGWFGRFGSEAPSRWNLFEGLIWSCMLSLGHYWALVYMGCFCACDSFCCGILAYFIHSVNSPLLSVWSKLTQKGTQQKASQLSFGEWRLIFRGIQGLASYF